MCENQFPNLGKFRIVSRIGLIVKLSETSGSIYHDFKPKGIKSQLETGRRQELKTGSSAVRSNQLVPQLLVI